MRKIEQETRRAQRLDQEADDKDPNISHLETELAEHIGCKVNIDFASKKGQLTIDFHNLEILEGLLEKMGFAAKWQV